MVTKHWNVVQLDCYPEADGDKDVVFTIHWTCSGKDTNGHSGHVYGSVGVKHDPKTPFTPYSKLTLAQTVGWAKEALGADQVKTIEKAVDSQVAEAASPKVVSLPLPWVPVPVAE